MNGNKPTCGPLFADSLSAFTDMSDKEVRPFLAGHLTGLVEKVYLGACPAAMVRPSPEFRGFVLSALSRLSKIYGLEVSVFERPEIADEIWLHRPEYAAAVGELSQLRFESPEWHTNRGLLCGIPLSEIDLEFHKRRGYREPCDK